ncbi:MAG: thioesterase family protein [Anaerolineales bacterium]|jgi:predicted thioesterase|nr:thioesterase family protein [Anaerolineales bacterium]
MDWSTIFQPGRQREEVFQVGAGHLASHVGSGAVSVLSTPSMIAFMETTALRLLAEALPAGFSSVGVNVNVSHLAPSLPGASIRVTAEVRHLEGSLVDLVVQAWDGSELVGDGTHRRAIIDEARFQRRLAAKAEKASGQ